jgi:hypothetical protein
MGARVFGYAGLLLILVSVAVYIAGAKETRYETAVARLKGRVIAKEIRPLRTGHVYGVTYRVTLQGRTLEREGDVGSQKTWDSLRIGDEVDVESIGVTPHETRLAAERVAGSGVYRWIAAGLAGAGLVLLVLRIVRARRGEGARTW